MVNNFLYKAIVFLLLMLIAIANAFTQDVAPPILDTTIIINRGEAYYQNSNEFEKINVYEILKAEERNVPDSVVSKFKNDNAFWYADYEPTKQKEDQGKSLKKNNKDWLRSFIWFIIVSCFIAVVIWFLVSSNVQLFRKKSKLVKMHEEEIVYQDIFQINYNYEIAKAKKEGNYRLAIRLWYLLVLKQMTQKNIIQYKHEKTNSDYLVSVFETVYYKDFFRLTRSFEYAWYGQFIVTKESYEGIENDFINFNQRIA